MVNLQTTILKSYHHIIVYKYCPKCFKLVTGNLQTHIYKFCTKCQRWRNQRTFHEPLCKGIKSNLKACPICLVEVHKKGWMRHLEDRHPEVDSSIYRQRKQRSDKRSKSSEEEEEEAATLAKVAKQGLPAPEQGTTAFVFFHLTYCFILTLLWLSALTLLFNVQFQSRLTI